jgi:predicted peroxiredoxin
MADFKELGGKLKVCGPCIKNRNIETSDLIEGAEITAAGRLIAESLKADAVFTY